MPIRLVSCSALTLALLAAPLEAGITFGPVRGKPGESIRLVARSESKDGTIERGAAGRTTKGGISLDRERELVWTFRDPAADGSRRGMVRVAKMTSSSVTHIDGKEDKAEDQSPLNGKLFAMTRSPSGDWSFELDGSVPLTRVREEIDELTLYLKRDWYPDHEVNVGDSWEFDPIWVKTIIEKDLRKAQTIGTMRLRQIRVMEGRRMAVIDMGIQSSGADFKADGTESGAAIELKGQLTVNLDTMLDESLELSGTVTTSARTAVLSNVVTLPVRFTTTKSFVRDPALR